MKQTVTVGLLFDPPHQPWLGPSAVGGPFTKQAKALVFSWKFVSQRSRHISQLPLFQSALLHILGPK